MDEGRKRVLGIIAGILVARHLKTPEDLSENYSTHRKPGGARSSVGGADHAEGGQSYAVEVVFRYSPLSTRPVTAPSQLKENPDAKSSLSLDSAGLFSSRSTPRPRDSGRALKVRECLSSRLLGGRQVSQ
jgi:hypothetical protein